MKILIALLIALPMAASAAIGSIADQQGKDAAIKRGTQNIAGKKGTGIESDDVIKVASESETSITFRDNTKVKIKANSQLVIDDFVFDPKASDAGKMAIKVAMGTVQYTSGQIAKANHQHINIKTPTAQIAVRGTDFSMTVDESGQSLIVLLPSCDDPKKLNNYNVDMPTNCTVGVIDVETSAGLVTLNQPYTATLVTSGSVMPLTPVNIDPLTPVNNSMILKLPGAVADAEKARRDAKEADKNKSLASSEEQLASKNKSSSATHAETTILSANAGGKTGEGDSCWPFNDCGNERKKNWYYRGDSNTNILIKSDEQYDNTTYSISVDSGNVETRTVGTGSNKVTVRIWNQ